MQVRFHPSNSRILASGDLDSEVCIWDALSGRCLHRHTFGRAIASLAFHLDGQLLAVASGHRVSLCILLLVQPQSLTRPDDCAVL